MASKKDEAKEAEKQGSESGLESGGIHFLECIDGALVCLGLSFGSEIGGRQRADSAGGLFLDGIAQQAKEGQCRNRDDDDDNDILDHCLARAFDVDFFHNQTSLGVFGCNELECTGTVVSEGRKESRKGESDANHQAENDDVFHHGLPASVANGTIEDALHVKECNKRHSKAQVAAWLMGIKPFPAFG